MDKAASKFITPRNPSTQTTEWEGDNPCLVESAEADTDSRLCFAFIGLWGCGAESTEPNLSFGRTPLEEATHAGSILSISPQPGVGARQQAKFSAMMNVKTNISHISSMLPQWKGLLRAHT